MKPAAHRLPAVDRTRRPREGQESGLENVFRILIVTEQAPAHPQDYRGVPPDEDFKGEGVPRST